MKTIHDPQHDHPWSVSARIIPPDTGPHLKITTSPEHPLELAQILEKGCFDSLFLADVVGVYDSYRGGPETSIIEGMQTSVNDPAFLKIARKQFSKEIFHIPGSEVTAMVNEVHNAPSAAIDYAEGLKQKYGLSSFKKLKKRKKKKKKKGS